MTTFCQAIHLPDKKSSAHDNEIRGNKRSCSVLNEKFINDLCVTLDTALVEINEFFYKKNSNSERVADELEQAEALKREEKILTTYNPPQLRRRPETTGPPSLIFEMMSNQRSPEAELAHTYNEFCKFRKMLVVNMMGQEPEWDFVIEGLEEEGTFVTSIDRYYNTKTKRKVMQPTPKISHVIQITTLRKWVHAMGRKRMELLGICFRNAKEAFRSYADRQYRQTLLITET